MQALLGIIIWHFSPLFIVLSRIMPYDSHNSHAHGRWVVKARWNCPCKWKHQTTRKQDDSGWGKKWEIVRGTRDETRKHKFISTTRAWSCKAYSYGQTFYFVWWIFCAFHFFLFTFAWHRGSIVHILCSARRLHRTNWWHAAAVGDKWHRVGIIHLPALRSASSAIFAFFLFSLHEHCVIGHSACGRAGAYLFLLLFINCLASKL